MLPKYFVIVDEIPLTINGKVNKKLLPKPTIETNSTFVMPENELEKSLYTVLCELLQTDTISTTDNFFNYYIDSLTIIKAQTRLLGLGYNIETQDFYEYPTIKKLASFIQGKKDRKANNEDVCSNIPKICDIQKNIKYSFNSDNILLIGATGFLGIHVLYELLNNTNANIYCLTREKNHTNILKRLKEKFNYYFKNDTFEQYTNRIKPIIGDLSKDKFGIDDILYNELGHLITSVIHTAAIVKHYGNYKDFYNINVLGTKRSIDFCNEFNIPLDYISTMSVSGYGFCNNIDATFDETNLYIGQDYKENVYVETKFEAEELILNSCKNTNLVASIYRVGNLTNRFIDGEFQENATENAFVDRIASIANLKLIPKDCLDYPIEFTPVDYCAKFIVKLLNRKPKNLNIYHLFNNNYSSFKDIIDTYKDLNINITTCSTETFVKDIVSADSTNFGIINYMNNILSDKTIKIDNSKTNKILNEEQNQWPTITKDYLHKFCNYLYNNDFIA